MNPWCPVHTKPFTEKLPQFTNIPCQVCTNSPKIWDYLKILDAQRVTWRKFHTKDPQILGANAQNLVAMANWQPESVHPCSLVRSKTVVITHPIFQQHHQGQSPWHESFVHQICQLWQPFPFQVHILSALQWQILHFVPINSEGISQF